MKCLRLVVTLPVLLLAAPAQGDQVINDDLIVTFSECVGFDCVNGETFGFDTLRLKENNLRIDFTDTSTTGSFPTTDWTIVANDSNNGGRNAFYITADDGAANQGEKFTIEDDAQDHAIYADSNRVGFGTNSPVLELHVVDGDSPGLRLEQAGSAGFTPQTWDLAGNETNFFVRDVTNGSTLPFRIFPGSSGDDALQINKNNNGNVSVSNSLGVGTATPDDDLHVVGDIRAQREDSTPTFNFQRTGTVNQIWQFQVQGQGKFQVRNNNSGNVPIIIDDDNDFVGINTATPQGQLDVNGAIFQRGTQLHADYVFKENYELESIEQHSAYMWEHSHLPAIPARTVDEQGREVIEVGSHRKGILEELEKAHIYIEQLHERVQGLEKELSKIKESPATG